MKQKTINTYSFNELSEGIKEQVISQYYDINTMHEWWDISLNEFIADVKKSTNIELTQKDITFEVGSRYAHFGVFDYAIERELSNKHYTTSIELPKKIGYSLSHRGGGICVGVKTGKNLAEAEFESEDDFQNTIKQKLIFTEVNKIIDLCETYFSKLHEEYEALTSNECIADSLEINEFVFLEDGRTL